MGRSIHALGVDSNSCVAPPPLPRPPLNSCTRCTCRILLPDGSVVTAAVLVSSSGACYRVGDVLKKAIYGQVVRGYVLEQMTSSTAPFRQTAERVAIKIFSKAKILMNTGASENPRNEIAIMHYVKHYRPSFVAPFEPTLNDVNKYPNLVHWIECTEDSCNIYNIMEFIDGKDLSDVIDDVAAKGQFLPEEISRKIFSDIVNGLRVLQSLGICHRDLSLENLMLTYDMSRCVIIDYGMSLRCHMDRDSGDLMPFPNPSKVGKPNYRSPEIMMNSSPIHGPPSDMWSLGVILFILFTNVPPVEEAIPTNRAFICLSRGQLHLMIERWGFSVPPVVIDLLKSLLRPSAHDRLTISQLMQHPWMNNDGHHDGIASLQRDDGINHEKATEIQSNLYISLL